MFKKKIIYKKTGFSLIEILISISIFLIISIISYNFIATGFRTSRFESEQATAIQEARKAMETIEKNIKMANDASDGSYAIEKAQSQELIIYSDIIEDSNNFTEKIKFFIDTNTNELKKIITEYNPIDQLYNSTISTTTISKYVNNQLEPLFYYYDNNGITTTVINEIRRIKFLIKINVTPTIAPNDYYLESDITLRNLKDNL